VEKLAERISRAHAAKKPFKVVVFIPLLPGFEGDVREEKSAVMRIQLYWEYWTICRSSKSLFKRLAHVKPLDQYLQFYSLRQHASTSEKLPLTEILYIHSKLIIADDRRMIIGSANINDRSLLGERDSEIALYIQEQQPVASPFGWEVSPGIQEFRVRLYEEHFGGTGGLSANPLDEQLWSMCQQRARTNTLIYREVFGCYPDDTMRNFAQIE
jgi:phospholipase D1/2